MGHDRTPNGDERELVVRGVRFVMRPVERAPLQEAVQPAAELRVPRAEDHSDGGLRLGPTESSIAELALTYHDVGWAGMLAKDAGQGARKATELRFERILQQGSLRSTRAQGLTPATAYLVQTYLHYLGRHLGLDRFIFLAYGSRYEAIHVPLEHRFGFAFRTEDLLARGAVVLTESFLGENDTLDMIVRRVLRRHRMNPNSVCLLDLPALRPEALREIVAKAEAQLGRIALTGERARRFLAGAPTNGSVELWLEEDLPISLAVKTIRPSER